MDKELKMMESIKKDSIRFEANDDLDGLIEAIGDRQFILLGESSHGTSEFYKTRMELSKRLIAEKGFSIIAVEGDWPSCFSVNEYIKGYKGESVFESLNDFNRWPTWMWANEEVVSLIEWLKTYNTTMNKNIGFYGIDVYSLWESMEALIKTLETNNSGDIEKAKKAFSCFEPFYRKPENYGISAVFYGEHCLDEVTDLLTNLRKNRYQYEKGQEESLNIQVNALVTQNAEKYYKAMVRGGPDDWNIRDHHMVNAIEEIVAFYGNNTKVIIWEHNTHIGDARATDMVEEGLVNVGQILREKYGNDNVFAVGFGTHRGTVIAAKSWGEEMEEMIVPVALDGSWEDLMHRAGAFNKYLLFHPGNESIFREKIGHRAIGVVYNAEYEHLGNYVPSIMSKRYDAFFYFDKTTALSPLKMQVLHV
ncbi:MAG TPA: erythromycin esterase family protein [Pseudoneobacillus sp.]|nr:erythromycin esterase family protein [Pseudoneobacillus sp.]